MCRSRRELANEHLLEKFGFDTAENEPCKVCPLSAYSSPRLNGPTLFDEAFGFNRVVLKLYYVPTTPPPADDETESEGFDFLNPWFLIPFLLCSCCCGYIAYLFYDGWRKNSEKRRSTKQASVVPNEVSVVPNARTPAMRIRDPETA